MAVSNVSCTSYAVFALPPLPENPTAIYGLSPASVSRPPPAPVLNPKNCDRHAAYRFSLALQCVVNIGDRSFEPIRSRVVQAGTLGVVGCILEAWLASKGFAVEPSSSASGLARETREQRVLGRQQMTEQQWQRNVQVMTQDRKTDENAPPTTRSRSRSDCGYRYGGSDCHQRCYG